MPIAPVPNRAMLSNSGVGASPMILVRSLPGMFVTSSNALATTPWASAKMDRSAVVDSTVNLTLPLVSVLPIDTAPQRKPVGEADVAAHPESATPLMLKFSASDLGSTEILIAAPEMGVLLQVRVM